MIQPFSFREFFRKYYLIPLFIVYAITRLPFLDLGYGADFDAWRVAAAAKEMLTQGAYTVSRFPGYPLFEIINAFIIRIGGWRLSNLFSCLIFAGSILIFDAILKELKAKLRIPSIILFSFFPLFWKNSVCTMDYLWGLFFILLSFLLVLKKHSIVSAIFLGITAGFRLTGFLFIIPFSLYLILNRHYKQLLLFIPVAAVAGIVSYSPALAAYGTTAFSFFTPAGSEWTHVLYYALYAAGIIPACLIIVILFFNGMKIIREIKNYEPVPIVCIASILLVLASFCFLPHEREYLIPLFPFLFILMGQYSGKFLFGGFIVVSLLYAFVMIEIKDTESIDRIAVKPHIDAGFVIRDFNERQNQLRIRKTLASFLRKKYGEEKKLVVVTGWRIGIPQVFDNPDFIKTMISPDDVAAANAAANDVAAANDAAAGNLYCLRQSEILIIAGPVDETRYSGFRGSGYDFVFIEGAIRYNKVAYDFTIAEAKADVISLAEIK